MALPTTPEFERALDLLDEIESGDIDLQEAILRSLNDDGITFEGEDLPFVTLHLVAELMRR